MTPRRAFWIGVGAVAAGLFVALAFSGEKGISVEVWVSSSAATVVAVVIRDFLRTSALEPVTMMPVWAPTPDEEPAQDAGRLLRLRSLVSSAQLNPRAHSQRLRSHLLELAGHFLPLRHGLDPERDETQVRALLGDVHWLIDREVNERSPTLAELARFVSLVMGDDDVGPAQPSLDGAAIL